MAAVDVVNMVVLDNPAPFTAPLQFEITYDVREPLAEDLEWKVIYVGSAEDPAYDQELDAVLLPADTPGRFAFVLAVDAPDVAAIPPADVVGVTIVLVTASYHGTEFVRVGYYVNNELVGAEAEAGAAAAEGGAAPPDATAAPGRPAGTAAAADAPAAADGIAPSAAAAAAAAAAGPVDVSKLVRNIAADEPRITKIPHKFDWGGGGPVGAPPVAPAAAAAPPVGGGGGADVGGGGAAAAAAPGGGGAGTAPPPAVPTTTAAVVGADAPAGGEGGAGAAGAAGAAAPAGAPPRNP